MNPGIVAPSRWTFSSFLLGRRRKQLRRRISLYDVGLSGTGTLPVRFLPMQVNGWRIGNLQNRTGKVPVPLEGQLVNEPELNMSEGRFEQRHHRKRKGIKLLKRPI